MSSLTELLDLYDISELKIDRYGFKAATNDLDFALIRHTDNSQAIWFDRDIGFRISSWNKDEFQTRCFIETIKDKQIAYQIESTRVSHRVVFDLKPYGEDEYFQVGLMYDISDLSFDDYNRFYQLYLACCKILTGVKRDA